MKRVGVATIALGLVTSAGALATEEQTLTDRSGKLVETVTRDDHGRVIQMVQPNGDALTFHYASSLDGCFDRIVHSDGTTDEFDCDGAGNSVPKSFGRTPEGK